MSEERLNEIKDSIDFQLRVCEINNYETDMIIEEKELYNEVLSNKILIQELRGTIDNQRETIERLNNIINECMESVSCIEHNLEKYEEIGLDHFDYALEKTRELKEYLYEELKENNK